MLKHHLGYDFPREGHVQAAVERHFAGCNQVEARFADFACIDNAGQRWVIEAKAKRAPPVSTSGRAWASCSKA